MNEEGPEIWGLDGRTGERKWTYKLPRESFTDWMEFVLVDLGNGRRGVSLLPRGVRSPSRWDVLVLDGQGRPCQQSWIDWAGADQPAQRFRSYDVDGDGVAEVFLIRDGKLRVTSCGVEQLLWEWPLPGGTGNIIDILPGLKESPAIIVIGMKGQAFGVDGRTGRPRWHCQGPGEAYAVLPTDDPRDLPRVLFRDRDPKNASNANTICRQALPIRPVKQEMKLEREVN